MKKNHLYLMCLIIPFSLLFGCEEVEDGDFVEPITVYEKVNGAWSLSSLIYVDEFAKANSLDNVEENLTDWFNFNTVVVSLNVDENNQPTNFMIEGDVPELLPSQGFWNLNSAFPTTNTKPIEINLFTDANRTDHSSTLRLISIPGAVSTMEIQLQRKSNDVVFASYNYKFFPIN